MTNPITYTENSIPNKCPKCKDTIFIKTHAGSFECLNCYSTRLEVPFENKKKLTKAQQNKIVSKGGD